MPLPLKGRKPELSPVVKFRTPTAETQYRPQPLQVVPAPRPSTGGWVLGDARGPVAIITRITCWLPTVPLRGGFLEGTPSFLGRGPWLVPPDQAPLLRWPGRAPAQSPQLTPCSCLLSHFIFFFFLYF